MPAVTRRLAQLAVFASLLFASCGPRPVPVTPTESALPSVPVKHAPEIRFALIGRPAEGNVWALFDEAGASYAGFAVRNEYWPRLYVIPPRENVLTPSAAGDMPSAVTQEADFFTGTVALRDDLKWTDGSSFTANDVVFTVQTALLFELTFDWKAYYNPEYLDHAEAVDAHTVKFYFKRKPGVAVWQYGALLGPIVQEAYWEKDVNEARTLLPDAQLHENLAAVNSDIETLTKAINEIHDRMPGLRKNGAEYRKADADLRRYQGNLDAANNKLSALQADYAARLKAAHEKLFSIPAEDEPTLGVWMFESSQGNVLTNEANPAHPFGEPNFDRAVYRFYPAEADAVAALQNNEVDMILEPDGLSAEAVQSLSGNDSIKVEANPRSRARFLVFNHARDVLSIPASRQALDCMVNRKALAEKYPGDSILPLETFVLPQMGFWYNSEAKGGCSGLEDAARLQKAVELLKSAGFTWAKEPGQANPGEGLTVPGGEPFPAMTLLAPSAESDAQRAGAANYVEQRAQWLGIPVKARLVDADEMLYSVYSRGDFDLAILGWRLGEYPSYVCGWFEPWDANPFHYGGDKPKSACEAFESASSIEEAQTALYAIQIQFAGDPPMIPLYTTVTYDAHRNLRYDFRPLNGLTGLYGAPLLAVPAP